MRYNKNKNKAMQEIEVGWGLHGQARLIKSHVSQSKASLRGTHI